MNKAAAHVSAAALTAMLSTSALADTTITNDYEVMHEPALQASKAHQAVLTEIIRTNSRTIAGGDYGLLIYRNSAAQPWQQAEVPRSACFWAVAVAHDHSVWHVGPHGV